jgi:hypothetical protein
MPTVIIARQDVDNHRTDVMPRFRQPKDQSDAWTANPKISLRHGHPRPARDLKQVIASIAPAPEVPATRSYAAPDPDERPDHSLGFTSDVRADDRPRAHAGR